MIIQTIYTFHTGLFFIKSLLQCVFAFCVVGESCATGPANFWSEPRFGSNLFVEQVYEQLHIADAVGKLDYMRLAPDRFNQYESGKFALQHRDFLVGDADNYTGLIPEHVEKLKSVLDMFIEYKLPVVLTMLTLPGSRWKQHNPIFGPYLSHEMDRFEYNDPEYMDDLRIWTDDQFQEQAIQFWKDLAHELRDYPILVGYNILNEPHPNRLTMPEAEAGELLNRFYEKVIAGIREVDQIKSIIIDSQDYASPASFKYLRAFTADENIMYSCHMSEPYEFTCYRQSKVRKLSYPGCVIDGIKWNKEQLQEYLQTVEDFRAKCNLDPNRIIVCEYSCDRRNPGAKEYMNDVAGVIRKFGWHFGYYAWKGHEYDFWDYPWMYTGITYKPLLKIFSSTNI